MTVTRIRPKVCSAIVQPLVNPRVITLTLGLLYSLINFIYNSPSGYYKDTEDRNHFIDNSPSGYYRDTEDRNHSIDNSPSGYYRDTEVRVTHWVQVDRKSNV